MTDPHKPPAGWLIASGILQADRTVRGYYTRRQDVAGRCHARDCRRSCQIDVKRLHADGLGSLRMDQVKAFYRCQRLDGCALVFHDDLKAESLKLDKLCRRPAVGVLLRCGGCKVARKISPEQMISVLKAEGIGGPETEIRELPRLLAKPCKACGSVAWDVQVAWPDPETWGGRRMIDMARPTTSGPIDPLDF